MGSLIQQVNLYRGHQAAADASSSGARLLLLTAIGALVTVLLVAAAGELQLSGLEAQQVALAGQLSQRQADLARTKEALAQVRSDPFLESELARLRQARTRMASNLTAIARQQAGSGEGFSAYFSGLARNTLDGLWLNNVAVSAGGAEMLLKGQATEPALVPRLLRSLAVEQAFAGRTFRKVSFERQAQDAGAIVDFELRSATAEEARGAG
ncbi:MAG: hypothetical protein LJE59_03110 [Chromatiaceae bacterium]|jgi:hypothetical protein|nr:hypothetical protein [Chromatiaceae bacterium]